MLNLEAHIRVMSSLHYQIRNIAKIRKYITEESAKIVVRALVISKLDNCTSLLYVLPKTSLSKVLIWHYLSICKQQTAFSMGFNYRRNKPTRDIGRTREKQLVNQEPRVSDLQAIRVFSQHPKWIFNAGKPTEIAGYLLLLK